MRIVIATLAVAAVSLGACGKKEEAARTTVTTGEGAYTVTSGGTTVTSSASAVAGQAGTPDYAPVFPGGVVKSNSTTSTNGHQVGSVTYLTSATPKAVVDFYKPKVAAAGFTTSADASVGVGLMFAAVDTAKQRSMQVIATTEKDGTAVVLTWTSPKS